jgi:hypothetical protein
MHAVFCVAVSALLHWPSRSQVHAVFCSDFAISSFTRVSQCKVHKKCTQRKQVTMTTHRLARGNFALLNFCVLRLGALNHLRAAIFTWRRFFADSRFGVWRQAGTLTGPCCRAMRHHKLVLQPYTMHAKNRLGTRSRCWKYFGSENRCRCINVNAGQAPASARNCCGRHDLEHCVHPTQRAAQ